MVLRIKDFIDDEISKKRTNLVLDFQEEFRKNKIKVEKIKPKYNLEEIVEVNPKISIENLDVIRIVSENYGDNLKLINYNPTNFYDIISNKIREDYKMLSVEIPNSKTFSIRISTSNFDDNKNNYNGDSFGLIYSFLEIEKGLFFDKNIGNLFFKSGSINDQILYGRFIKSLQNYKENLEFNHSIRNAVKKYSQKFLK